MTEKEKSYIRYQGKMLWCITEKGGKCEKCEKNLIKNPWDSNFHHKNPKNKVGTITWFITNNKDGLMEEIKKCQLLCSRCHRETHLNKKMYKKLLPHIKNYVKNFNINSYKLIDEDAILEKISQGKSCKQIAKEIKRSRRVVLSVIRRIEIKKNKKLLPTKMENSSKSKLTDIELINLVKSGTCQKNIAKSYKVTVRTIYNRVHRLRGMGMLEKTSFYKRTAPVNCQS